MWAYEKRTQYPINIKKNDAKAAMIIISQYGGPDGEIGASMRYLSQKFSFKNPRVSGLLNDIGTEELAHLEMVGTIVHQLTCNLSPEEIKASGLVRGEIQSILFNYKIRQQTVEAPPQKEVTFRLMGGVEFGNTLQFDSFLVKGNLGFQNKKGNVCKFNNWE